MLRITRLLFLLSLIVSLAACGYHLRGSGPRTLTVNSVHVQSSGANKLAHEVKNQLNGFGVSTPASAEEAEYVLSLSAERENRKVLTVAADTGKVQEYEVSFSATMSVTDAAGQELGKNQTIRAKRDLTVDEDAVLGKFEEERTIQEELRKQAASSVLRRLQAVTR